MKNTAQLPPSLPPSHTAPPAQAEQAEERTQAFAERLREFGLRPTRQRLTIFSWLFPHGPDRVIPHHYSAEALKRRAAQAGANISLATIYNTLNQFSNAGLLRKVTGGEGRTFYDTNTEPHHHVYDEARARLEDIPENDPVLSRLAQEFAPRDGQRLEVMLRLRPEADSEFNSRPNGPRSNESGVAAKGDGLGNYDAHEQPLPQEGPVPSR